MTELTQADRETLRRMIERDWADAVLAADWNATLALCSDDVAYLAADSPPLHGKEQVREFFEAFPPIIADDGPVSGEGKFLATASKSSGEWLFTASCFNWNAPPS
jgi:ketosteroid isomerase-like protein